jgi:lysophospholipase L1-like esterase
VDSTTPAVIASRAVAPAPQPLRRVQPFAAAALAVALGAFATRTLRPRAAPPDVWPQAIEAAARADRGPRGPHGGPLRPAPIVSRGRRVAASRPGAGVLVDGVYRKDAWCGGVPSVAAPAWVAIDVGRGPARVLLSWTSSYNHDYRDLFYGAPADYRIETSADSTDGADGTWRAAVAIRGNPVRSRAHAVDFAGQRWIRLVVTGLARERNEWGLFLDEIDVHDLSLGGDDVWVLLGDSIAAGVFDRAPGHRPSFADRIATEHPGYQPAIVDAGLCRATAGELLARIDDLLAWNPDAHVFAITIGTNDADAEAFRRNLDALVARIEAAGRIAVVARIPFRTGYGEEGVPPKNAALDAVVQARGLLPGPDLYAWFRAHPERLADTLHPDDRGSVEMSRLWAEAVSPLYPR